MQKLHSNEDFHFKPTRCGAAASFIQNIVEKENINVEKIFFTAKLKPNSSHRMHIFITFSRGTSIISHKRRMFRKPCKINVSST